MKYFFYIHILPMLFLVHNLLSMSEPCSREKEERYAHSFLSSVLREKKVDYDGRKLVRDFLSDRLKSSDRFLNGDTSIWPREIKLFDPNWTPGFLKEPSHFSDIRVRTIYYYSLFIQHLFKKSIEKKNGDSCTSAEINHELGEALRKEEGHVYFFKISRYLANIILEELNRQTYSSFCACQKQGGHTIMYGYRSSDDNKKVYRVNVS